MSQIAISVPGRFLVRRLWNKYLDCLQRRPLTTQMAQSTIMLGLGDVIAQRLVEKRAVHDHARTLRFMGIGCFFVAPLIRGWYLILEKAVRPRANVSPLGIAFRKMGLDQGLFAPFSNFLFISVVGSLQDKSVPEIKEKLKDEWLDIMKKNYQIWPGVQLVNFFYVPMLLRPLVVGVVALFWNSYLSWKTNKL